MQLSDSPSQSPVHPGRGAGNDKLPSSVQRLGRYVVTGRLGRGGMGVVYEAEDSLLKRAVAIKLLPKDVSSHPESLKRFLREGQGAARLNHPNVVAVYDIGEADGTHFIVMELITGGSAQDFLRQSGPFHWREATSILADVCRGVAAAHKAGLVHRDIKPANILRSMDGIVKLGDFGLVKAVKRKGTVVTALGEVLGTPHYMSPEQSQSAGVDERSDIYSLGATYFALLTGRPPFQGDDAAQVLFAHCSYPIPDPRVTVNDIPEDCTRIIQRAMAKHRAQRYANAGLLLADLEQVLAASAHAMPATAQPQPFVWSKANAAQETASFSLAEAYPAEHSRTAMRRLLRRHWKMAGLALVAMLMVAVLVKLVFLGGRVEEAQDLRSQPPLPVKDDWDSQAAAADKAIRARDAAGMRNGLDALQRLRKRTPGEPAGQDQTISRLQRAIDFRERITDKGLVLGVDGWVSSLAISQDDRMLAVGQISGGAGALIFDGHTGEKLHSLWPITPKRMVKVHALSLARDGSLLAAACANSPDIKVWRFEDGKETPLYLGAGVNRALAVAMSGGKNHLVAGLEPSFEGRGRPYLKIWNLDTGLEAFPFKVEHSARVASVAFTAGSQQIASGSHDKRVILWNAETGRIWRELHTGLVIRAVECDPQGRSLVVAGLNADNRHELQFWDYAADTRLASKPSPHGACRCVAFARRGDLVASGSGNRVLLWDASTRELLATLSGHNLDVTSLAFFSEGGILATGSEDQTVRLWDVSRILKSRPAS